MTVNAMCVAVHYSLITDHYSLKKHNTPLGRGVAQVGRVYSVEEK